MPHTPFGSFRLLRTSEINGIIPLERRLNVKILALAIASLLLSIWYLANPGNASAVNNCLSSGRQVYDDTNGSVVYYGTWTHYSNAATKYCGGTVSYSSTYGDYVNLTFTGSRITVLFTMAYNRSTNV